MNDINLILYPAWLVLRNFEISEEGAISGWVVNGAWFYKESGNTASAYDSEQASSNLENAVTTWQLVEQKVIVAKADADYNELLEMHSLHANQRHELPATIAKASTEIKTSTKPNSGWLDIDDDFPF